MPSDPYLVFLGRISPEKRPDRAISIAKRLGMRLKIAAKVDAADAAYFRDEIKPLLADPLIEFIGEIGDSEKSAFLGNAGALLFPIDWPEPFGLVLIEAMAMWNACDRVALRVRLRDRDHGSGRPRLPVRSHLETLSSGGPSAATPKLDRLPGVPCDRLITPPARGPVTCTTGTDPSDQRARR